MGNDFCSCLNDLTTYETKDLSRDETANIGKQPIEKNPKIIYKKISTIESTEPFSSQREKDSITKRSSYKKNSNSHSNSNHQQNLKSNGKKNNLKNNLNNNKNTKKNKNNNNNKDNNEKSKSIKRVKKEELVSPKFKNFFNTIQGQTMTLNMNEDHNKLCIMIHKYLISLITKKEFNKDKQIYKEDGENLYINCIKKIYNSNPTLKKAELVKEISYSPEGYLKYYKEKKDIETMTLINPKETFDNNIIIKYSEDNPSNNDNIIWAYKGQSNKYGEPHGFGEKIVTNGIKQKGYWKNGEMYGWGQMIDNKGDIFIGPFYDNKGLTGKGEKYSTNKKILYIGEFINGEKSGYGEEMSKEGKFVGYFQKDKKNGKGKMVYKISGDTYEGEYKDDLFHGNGHYIWKTRGQEYKGEYKNGLMHGQGLFEWSEGEYYRGNFVNGKKEGEGELHMGNGRSFIGPFSNGRPNGVGIFDNGIDFQGEMEFIDGKMNINYIKTKYTSSNYNSNSQKE